MKKWYHLLFLVVCGVVLLILLNAPEVTTPRLPDNETHQDRKQFEACPACHGPDSDHPMPEDHLLDSGEVAANHLKCYFCHKTQD